MAGHMHLISSICKVIRGAVGAGKSHLMSALDRNFIGIAHQMMPALAGFPTSSNMDPTSFDGLLLAVPKKRRTLEKRRIRSFGFTDRMEHTIPKENIVTCPKCNHWHESHTICGHCYEKVRQKTAEMRAMLDKEDAYYFNQSDTEIKDLLEKNCEGKDTLSWWNDNLKTKVK